MLQAREIQRDEPKVEDVFTITPKGYAYGVGISLSAAERFFKKALRDPELSKFFRRRGIRIYASRSWFDLECKIS